ncbi:WDR46 (predicted), partial [Pycnogonum litorale]
KLTNMAPTVRSAKRKPIKRYFIEEKDENLKSENKRKEEPKSNDGRVDETDGRRFFRQQKESYPGSAPIPEEKLKKYERGKTVKMENIGTKFHRRKFSKIEQSNQYSLQQAARSELLLPEESGFIEPDDGEKTYEIEQSQIKSAVDICSATKHFDLNLKFGPYSMDYTRNGRHLVIGGKKGHVSAIDWVTKRLLCEINVMESVHDVRWLHMHTMFAAAQKNWVYIYDNAGVELHCVKNLYRVVKMEFLPYHFLLATISDNGFLSWLDISIGKMISQYPSKLGYLNVMCQNPYNAIVVTGHSNGTISMWSPNNKQPLVKMLCHPRPITSVQVDPTGNYLATAAVDGFMNMWDVRMYKQLQSYKLSAGASNLSFSQRGLLAVSTGNIVEIYKDCCTESVDFPYLRHDVPSTINGMKFCPYEDVLGVSHNYGFTSMLTPGSGEPNFDSFESNPFMTKSQRKEMEVKALLEKIQPELICLDPNTVDKVDVNKNNDNPQQPLVINPTRIDFIPKHKMKGKSGSSKIFKRKQAVQNEARQQFVRQQQLRKNQQDKTPTSKTEKRDVLDRF